MERITKAEAEQRARLLSNIECYYDMNLQVKSTYRVSCKVFATCSQDCTTWLDSTVLQITDCMVNDQEWDTELHLKDNRLALNLKEGVNSIRFNYEQALNLTSLGGLQAFRNNDEFYMYSTPIFSISTIFPCFAQPDLKTKLQVSVTINSNWEAASNGAIVEQTFYQQEGLKHVIFE